jgi:hypothetical protein
LGIFCSDHGSTVILRSGHLERESQRTGTTTLGYKRAKLRIF